MVDADPAAPRNKELMNFTLISFLDTYDLACSLRPRAGMFGGSGVRTLHLRGPKKGAEDPDDESDYGRSREAARWPEFKTLIGRIERLGEQIFSNYGGGHVEFGRIFLEWLDVGATVPWRKLEGDYFERFNRLHLALRTNPGCMLYSGVEAIQLPPGQMARMNVMVPHSAVNLGASPRVHLVLDVRRAGRPAEAPALNLPEVVEEPG